MPSKLASFSCDHRGMALIRCVFCNRDGRESEEDLIPRWANKVLRELTGATGVLVSLREVDIDEKTVLQSIHRRHQTFSAIRIPEVCETCNNGWMSQIENAAKPLLEPMIRGQRRAIPPRDQKTIATWMALKTLVAERMDKRIDVATAEDYHDFYARQEPPDGFLSRLGRLDVSEQDTGYFALDPKTTARSLNGVPAGLPFVVYFTFSLRCLLFQTMFITKQALAYPGAPPHDPDPFWTWVWPPRDEVNWPPPFTWKPSQLPASLGKWPDAEEWIAAHPPRRRHEAGSPDG